MSSGHAGQFKIQFNFNWYWKIFWAPAPPTPFCQVKNLSTRSGEAPLTGLPQFFDSLVWQTHSDFWLCGSHFGDKRWETKSNYITDFCSFHEKFVDNWNRASSIVKNQTEFKVGGWTHKLCTGHGRQQPEGQQ